MNSATSARANSHARWAVAACFLLMGLLIGAWVLDTYIPAEEATGPASFFHELLSAGSCMVLGFSILTCMAAKVA